MHTCVCTDAQMCVLNCVHACGGRRSTLGSLGHALFDFKTGSFSDPGLIVLTLPYCASLVLVSHVHFSMPSLFDFFM